MLQEYITLKLKKKAQLIFMKWKKYQWIEFSCKPDNYFSEIKYACYLSKDEDCWIGELNGLRGWFPAKFVQLLDERSKQYSSAGDDSVSENIAHLVRGSLAPTIKQVLEHGMKRSSILGNLSLWLDWTVIMKLVKF